MENNFFAELKSLFQKFPGIGPRQASRFVYSLVDFSEDERKKMGEMVSGLDKYLRRCESCFRMFPLLYKDPLRQSVSEARGLGEIVCNFCGQNSKRDKSKVIIVEKDSDLLNFEKTRTYEGLYFVLGGLFDPLEENITPKNRIEIFKKNSGKFNEVVLALPSTKLGDFTCEYIKKTISSHPARITRFARGISSGVELEYMDENTLKHAFLNRK